MGGEDGPAGTGRVAARYVSTSDASIGPVSAQSRPLSLGGAAIERRRLLLALAWPPALAAAIYLAFGRLGFFPSDEGLVLSYTYRLLHGQVPHRDFISPRPLGSALIHLIDFAIPGPLFEVSRVIALGEFVAYTIAFAWLIYEVAPWRWNLAMVAGAMAATLVDMNRFPLMAWYTVDGLLLVGAGLLLVRSGARRGSWTTIAAAFVVLGFAGLTKQSFAPAVALGWLALWPRLRSLSLGRRLKDVVMTGAYAAAPVVIYVAAIAAAGGFRAMRAQLLGAPLVYGQSLFLYPWLPDHDLGALIVLVVISALCAAAVGFRSKLPAWGHALSASALTATVVWVTLSDQLGMRGEEWGIRLFYMAAAFAIVLSITRRSLDVVGVILVVVGWMVSLSYSFFYPDLAAGCIAVYLVHRSWSGATLPSVSVARAAPATAALVILAITAVAFSVTREQDVYLDKPAQQLKATLSSVSPAFGDIRTNDQTANYLAQMSECVKQYPAKYVAILPENAGMYPALGLSNPFPIDWIWPLDVHGSESRIVATTDWLNQHGDYLVLFQTVDAPQVLAGTLTPARPDSAIYAFSPIPQEIYSRLDGSRSTCGTFLVVYSPPAS